MELHISTDLTIKDPSIGFIVNGSFNDSNDYWRSHPPVLDGHPLSAYHWGKIHTADKAIIPNSFGILMEIAPTLSPGSDLVLTIESDINAHVSGVRNFE